MSGLQITAKHLAVRLGTVARDLHCEAGEVPLYIRINGQRHALTIDNFKVDDDGSLMFDNELLQPIPLDIRELVRPVVRLADRHIAQLHKSDPEYRDALAALRALNEKLSGGRANV